MVITVQKLTADDLDALYDDLEESGGQRQQGLSPKTVANIHGIIHKALADAVKRGKVGVNVADIVDAPRSSRTRPQVWEANQLRCFLRHVSEDRILRRVAAVVDAQLACTGMGVLHGVLLWHSARCARARRRMCPIPPTRLRTRELRRTPAGTFVEGQYSLMDRAKAGA